MECTANTSELLRGRNIIFHSLTLALLDLRSELREIGDEALLVVGHSRTLAALALLSDQLSVSRAASCL